MFLRDSRLLIAEDLRDFPVVTLLGARQVGKTTVARQVVDSLGVDSVFLDLEKDEDRNKLTDAAAFLRMHANKLVVIDEAQAVPDIFRVLRPLVDEDRSAGRFLLLGSATPALVKGVSESLAGRTTYIKLQPLSVIETTADNLRYQWFTGGYPASVLAVSARARQRWFAGYIESYIQNDLNTMFGINLSPVVVKRLWSMLAHNHGNLWNAESFSRALGISGTTVHRYLEYMEGAFVVQLLQPWHANLKKRLIKSPKVFLNDSGLLHQMLNIRDSDSLLGNPICGASWEGFVIQEIMKQLPEEVQIHFYRTQHGAECDLVLSVAEKPILALDVKLSNAPSVSRGFIQSLDDLGLEKGWVITPESDQYPLNNRVNVISLSNFLGRIKSLDSTEW